MNALLATSPTQDLCLTCGLCCDGTLFRGVEIDLEREGPTFVAIGAVIEQEPTKTRAVQPCVAFESCACTIYPNRPRACQTYQCQLLKHCLTGEVSWEKAREIVASAVGLRDGIAAEVASHPGYVPGTRLVDHFRRLNGTDEAKRDRPAFIRKYGRVLLDFTELLRFSRLHFQSPEAPAAEREPQ